MGANPQYAEGDVIANKFIVEGPLGESAAGHVFLANGNFGSQKIVVKFYRTDVSAHLLAAPDFFLKAAAMTEIEHDNLCSSLDVQEEMGLAFVARAFAEGVSFEEWLRKARSDANYFPRGLELLWQASQGLIALHERTRHLNIHPGNIIVGNMVAKLCDWDPRALTSSEMTPEALPLRSEYRGYRAPEVSGNGSFLSYPSTDLFAIAGLLYRLIKGDHPMAYLQQTLQEVRGFEKDIAIFLTKAMHPKPEERFQEANSFSDALWDLKPAMERLQERYAGMAQPRAPDIKERKPAPDFEQAFPAKEPTLMGMPQPTPKDDDSFFQFFPPPDETPSQKPAPVKPTPTHSFSSHDPFAPSPEGGDTLFGSPSIPATPKTPNYQQPKSDFASKPKSGLESLESSGTLFGNSEPLFSSSPSQAPLSQHNQPNQPNQPKARPKPEPVKSQPSKPLAVSLSSLEKDPLDLSGGDATAGFTQFGFKGAGENRTGIFTPEQKAAAAKSKLVIILVAVGGLILLLCLGGLFLFLRGTAAPKVEPQAAAPLVAEDESGSLAQDPQNEIAPETNAPPPAEVAPPPTPKVTETPVVKAPPPPKPIAETPRPEPKPTPVAEEPMTENGKVSSQRLTELMAMVQTRTWPPKAAQRLQAANDFNDMGKTAEANMAYGKTLAAADATEKQKVSALGGLAITFQAMGMNDQARDAVDRILEINPKNSFALKLKEKLK